MAETVILLAIKKIGIALGNEATQQAGAQFAKYVTQLTELQGRMGHVMRELRVMHDFLYQMDIRNRNNQVYEGWLEEVRKVAYVIEDMVDEYLYLVGRERDVGCCFYLKKLFKQPKALLSLNKIASMVKEIEANLIHLSQTKERWVLTMNNGDTTNSSYIVQKSHELASISRSLGEDLVGIEDNKQTLVQWLVDDELARLWIAEGFIEKRGQSTIEEVAEGYLKELVHRNMLQLIERNTFGRIKSFRMHDIVRELAVDLRRRECFGVAYEEDKYGGVSLEEKDGRRLVIYKVKKGSIPESISSAHHLRSVIALDNSMPASTLLSLIAEKCRYMSVLELSGLPIENVPDAIGDLFNLYHLGLRDSKVKLLPKSIEKLSNLLTLDLYRSNIQELPRGITKLKKLRHLFAQKLIDTSRRIFQCGTGVCIPKGLECLRDLQTLQALEAQDGSIRHLGELRQLRTIRIWNVKRIYCECLCESLVQMQFLSFLSIIASDEDEVLELNGLNPSPLSLQRIELTGRLAEGTLEECPLFQTAGQNLFSLGLFWSQLREDPLPCLSRLSSLTQLELSRAYSGEQLAFLIAWFPKLKILKLIDLPNLKRLEIQQGAMASLDAFILVNLISMTEVPHGIEFLASLQRLGFHEITPEFFTLLRGCPRIGGMRWWYTLRD